MGAETACEKHGHLEGTERGIAVCTANSVQVIVEWWEKHSGGIDRYVWVEDTALCDARFGEFEVAVRSHLRGWGQAMHSLAYYGKIRTRKQQFKKITFTKRALHIGTQKNPKKTLECKKIISWNLKKVKFKFKFKGTLFKNYTELIFLAEENYGD